MSGTTNSSDVSAAREDDTNRLAVLQRQAEVGSQVWTLVHEQIQEVLRALDDRVRSSVPDLRVDSARTQGRNFCLFSYRRYSRINATDSDAVVAGLTFAHVDAEGEPRIAIDADISWEGTGDWIVELAQRTVPQNPEELLDAGGQMAAQLSQHGQRIAEALVDPSRNR